MKDINQSIIFKGHQIYTGPLFFFVVQICQETIYAGQQTFFWTHFCVIADYCSNIFFNHHTHRAHYYKFHIHSILTSRSKRKFTVEWYSIVFFHGTN